MPNFIHGKQTRVYVGGYDLSAYMTKLTTDQSLDAVETTVFGAQNKQYLAGLPDGTMSGEGLYDSAVGAITDRLNAMIGQQNVVWVALPEGDAPLAQGIAMLAQETRYQQVSDIGDAIKVSFEAQNQGLSVDHPLVAFAKASRAATGAAASIDTGAAGAPSTSGGVAYLEVFSVAGGSPSITMQLETSADNVTFVAVVATAATFTAVGAQRLAIPAGVTLNRYVRLNVTALTGGPFTVWAGFARK